jgi:hypothetical protein
VFVLTKHKDMAMATALKRRCKKENKLMAAPKSRPRNCEKLPAVKD